MKLNYKRTILVGFAFFLISAFWQIYDVTIATTLTNKFGMSQTVSGIVMALDNVLALFMLPLFGGISDRCKSKSGRRTPFIRTGTILAVVFLMLLAFADNAQLKKIESYSDMSAPATLERIYDEQKDAVLKTPDGEEYTLAETYSREEFSALGEVLSPEWEEAYKQASGAEKDALTEWKANAEDEYIKYVVPARLACVSAVTDSNYTTLIVFIAILLLLLIAMATFRTPAVALMPDVTVKPLRSKANAVINLMGSAGGIIALLVGIVLSISNIKNSYMSYTGVFALIGGLMLVALLIFLFTVKEPLWVSEMQKESARLGLDREEAPAESVGKRRLTKSQKISLALILASIVLWFFGYNAITSKFAVYAQNVLNKDAATALLLAQAAAIVSYIPVGIVASKVGRKKTILAGVVMLFAAFLAGCFLTSASPAWMMNAMLCLAGVAWATINVNSFPMVVEICTGADVGKYTGFYYTASMAAQSLTPLLSGFFMDKIAMTTLFPYSAIFVGLAFFTMLFVKHGDSKPVAATGVEALAGADD